MSIYSCLICDEALMECKHEWISNDYNIKSCHFCDTNIDPLSTIFVCNALKHGITKMGIFVYCNKCIERKTSPNQQIIYIQQNINIININNKRDRLDSINMDGKDDIGLRPKKRRRIMGYQEDKEIILNKYNIKLIKINEIETGERKLQVKLKKKNMNLIMLDNPDDVEFEIHIWRKNKYNKYLYEINSKDVDVGVDGLDGLVFNIKIPDTIYNAYNNKFGVNLKASFKNGNNIFNIKYNKDTEFELDKDGKRPEFGCFNCKYRNKLFPPEILKGCINCGLWFHKKCGKNDEYCKLCESMIYGTLGSGFNTKCIKNIFKFLKDFGGYKYILDDNTYAHTPDKLSRLLTSTTLNGTLNENDKAIELCAGTGSISRHVKCKLECFEINKKRYDKGFRFTQNNDKIKWYHMDITSNEFINQFLLNKNINDIKVLYCNPEYKLFFVSLYIGMVLLRNSILKDKYIMMIIPDTMLRGSLKRWTLWRIFEKNMHIVKEYPVGNVDYYANQRRNSSPKRTPDSIVRFEIGETTLNIEKDPTYDHLMTNKKIIIQ